MPGAAVVVPEVCGTGVHPAILAGATGSRADSVDTSKRAPVPRRGRQVGVALVETEARAVTAGTPHLVPVRWA
ncbi:hypothetical protein GCM10028832_43590 [Streptomyces sparsus]